MYIPCHYNNEQSVALYYKNVKTNKVNRMNKVNARKVLILLLMVNFLALSAQEKAADLGDFFSKGVYDLKLRLSYEYSDVDNKQDSDPGKGLTLSSYVGYRTAELGGFSFYTQFHNLLKIDDRYNDTHGKYAGEYDKIADPDGSRIQQLYVDFTKIPDTKIRLGRQQLLIDDVRFIGNVGWRQTAQVFDGITVSNKSIKDTTLFLGYIDKVATIGFQEAEFDGIWLANAKYYGIKGHTQTAFAYLVDSEGTSRDTATFGARANGQFGKLKYDMTYAFQSDYEDSEDRALHFFQGYLGYDFGGIEPGIGYSYIDGADTSQTGDKGFDTLFSTAHKFNGWADQFLATNKGGVTNGLQDFYASLKFKTGGFNFLMAYHFYDTTESHSYSNAYGQELNFLVSRKLNKQLTATAKVAYYDEFSHAGNPTADEMVVWLRLDYALSGPVSDPFKPFND